MIVCPRCGIEYESGKEFCRTCGSFLLINEEPSPDAPTIKTQLICPVCQDLHLRGNYCKKCGSQLVEGTPLRMTTPEVLEKKWVKRRSKEWLKLLKEKKELENCLNKLETQKSTVSSEVINPLLAHYQDRLKELSALHHETGVMLESVRKSTLEKIDILEKELKPIQKRLEELQFLFRQGGMVRSDFLREKKMVLQRIQPKLRSLKLFQQMLAHLPKEMEGKVVAQGCFEGLSRSLTLLIVCGLILFISAGGVFLWQRQSHSNRLLLQESIIFPPAPSSSKGAQNRLTDPEVEKIKSLFETVKQANLQQNIDLFMTCFSRDFDDREKKRLEALKTWEHFDYHHLSYDFKKQVITGDTASVQLEWLISAYEKVSGKLQENRIILEAILIKEGGNWKIQEIKPAG